VGELARRVLVAAVGIPLTIVLIWYGGLAFGAVLAVIAGIATGELFRLAQARGSRPLDLLGIPAAVALPVLAALLPTLDRFAPAAVSLLSVLVLVTMAAVVFLRGVEEGPLGAAGTTVLGAAYTGGTLAFALLLRHLPDGGVAAAAPRGHGAFLVAFPLAVTWMGDSCAYFAGKWWGEKKLMVRVSPNKTVVGGVAGLIGAGATGAVVAILGMSAVPTYGVGPAGAVVLGVLVGAGAQVGDLAESVLKREAGVKDSGSLFPGHGGALDRFDALFFSIPLAYALIRAGAWIS